MTYIHVAGVSGADQAGKPGGKRALPRRRRPVEIEYEEEREPVRANARSSAW
jgi:hypothetical protein